MDSPTSTTKPEEIWDMLADPNFGLTRGEKLAHTLQNMDLADLVAKIKNANVKKEI